MTHILNNNDRANKIKRLLGLIKNEIISEAKSEIFEKKYMTNTDSARENKIFGSPSFVVENEIFWGDDRMEDAIKWAKK